MFNKENQTVDSTSSNKRKKLITKTYLDADGYQGFGHFFWVFLKSCLRMLSIFDSSYGKSLGECWRWWDMCGRSRKKAAQGREDFKRYEKTSKSKLKFHSGFEAIRVTVIGTDLRDATKLFLIVFSYWRSTPKQSHLINQHWQAFSKSPEVLLYYLHGIKDRIIKKCFEFPIMNHKIISVSSACIEIIDKIINQSVSVSEFRKYSRELFILSLINFFVQF